MKVGIVGGGLTGCIIAEYLRKKGASVTVFDSLEKMGASKAALGLIAPQWIARVEDVDLGMEALEEIGGGGLVEHLDFEIKNPVKNFRQQIMRFNTQALVYGCEKRWDKVVEVRNQKTLVFADGDEMTFDIIILAAGIWCNAFIPELALSGKTGSTLFALASDNAEVKNKIEMYAPFKQAVSFQSEGFVHFGDGTSVKEYKEDHLKRTIDRASRYGNLKKHYAVTTGTRPFSTCNPNGVFKRVGKTLWVATGGAKNGTILAGIWANKLGKMI